MHSTFSLQQILQALSDLIEAKLSGTLFIHSSCNHSITFALEKGEIFAIFYGARRGLKAIPLISEIEGGTYRFESSELSGISQELPPTPEILNQLKTAQIDNLEQTANASGITHVSSGASSKSKDKLCQELKNLLVDYVGPIAEMVFDETAEEIGDFCASPALTQNLIDTLSEDIADPNEVTRFREQAYTLINRSMKH